MLFLYIFKCYLFLSVIPHLGKKNTYLENVVSVGFQEERVRVPLRSNFYTFSKYVFNIACSYIYEYIAVSGFSDLYLPPTGEQSRVLLLTKACEFIYSG